MNFILQGYPSGTIPGTGQSDTLTSHPLKSLTPAEISSQAYVHTHQQKQNQLHSHDIKYLQQFVRFLPYCAPVQKHTAAVAYSI